MRYSTPVYFQTAQKGEYNPETGNYDKQPPAEVQKYASVTDTGTNALQLIYGELKQGSLTVRLQRPYAEIFDTIRIGTKIYNVDRSSLYKRVFIVSEVQ